jgi:hypothetical protein
MPTSKPNRIEIQNALRILCLSMPAGVALEFGNGDLVTMTDHNANGRNRTLRTQETADIIHDTFGPELGKAEKKKADEEKDGIMYDFVGHRIYP